MMEKRPSRFFERTFVTAECHLGVFSPNRLATDEEWGRKRVGKVGIVSQVREVSDDSEASEVTTLCMLWMLAEINMPVTNVIIKKYNTAKLGGFAMPCLGR